MNDELLTLLRLKGKPYQGRIECWQLTKYFGSAEDVIRGYLHDKPGRAPQIVTSLRTSPLVKIHEEEQIAETMNSCYKLGAPYYEKLDGMNG